MASKFGLVDVVEVDGSLDRETKLLYRSLAGLYESDFANNLSLSSLELNDKYTDSDNPALWQRFLNHSSVKAFIETYLYERAEKKALVALGETPKDSNAALKVKDTVDRKRKKDDNSHIVVMLLPQKDLE